MWFYISRIEKLREIWLNISEVKVWLLRKWERNLTSFFRTIYPILFKLKSPKSAQIRCRSSHYLCSTFHCNLTTKLSNHKNYFIFTKCTFGNSYCIYIIASGRCFFYSLLNSICNWLIVVFIQLYLRIKSVCQICRRRHKSEFHFV